MLLWLKVKPHSLFSCLLGKAVLRPAHLHLLLLLQLLLLSRRERVLSNSQSLQTEIPPIFTEAIFHQATVDYRRCATKLSAFCNRDDHLVRTLVAAAASLCTSAPISRQVSP